MSQDHKATMADLMRLRVAGRNTIRTQKALWKIADILTANRDAAIKAGDRKAEALAQIDLDACNEKLLEMRFRIIEIGNIFNIKSDDFDLLPREVWLRALGVNEAEWTTPDMLKHGDTIRHVVGVLDLENSATKDDAIEFKPLKWCTTMAMLNATKTNPKFGEVVHEFCNKAFDGAFGDWKEPSVMERLGVKNYAA